MEEGLMLESLGIVIDMDNKVEERLKQIKEDDRLR